jgi:ribosomal protein L1
VVTEDQDFSPAMNLVKELGKHVELAVFPDAQSREMIRAADKIVSLDEVVKSNSSHIFPPTQATDVHPNEEMGFEG